MPSTIIEWLSVRAHDAPATPAFVVDDGVLTYEALHARVTGLARVLVREGLIAGQRCVLRLPTSCDLIAAIYAVQWAGGVPCLLDPGLTPASLARRMTLVRPAMVITAEPDPVGANLAATMPPVTCLTMREIGQRSVDPGVRLRAPAPSDLAYLQFTSGTAGEPRAIAVSHRALLAQLDAMADRFSITASDIVVSRASLAHSTGLVRSAFGTVRFGCRTHMIRPSAFDLGRWLPVVSNVRATITHGTDFGFRYAVQARIEAPLDLRALRVATNGGDVVRASTIIEFERRFGLVGVVQPAYGLSEATLIVASGAPGEPLRVDAHQSVSCGTPLQGLSVRIVDEAGAACPAGVTGEIEVRGNSLCEGYVDRDQETRDLFRGAWLATGDLGAVDSGGRLYPRARAKAMIKRAGVTIAPREIEEAVEQLAGVGAAAAIGAARPGHPSDDIVVVVETSDARPDVWAALLGRVHRVVREAVGIVPARVILVRAAAIPRTDTGKIRRGLLPVWLHDKVFRDQVLLEG